MTKKFTFDLDAFIAAMNSCKEFDTAKHGRIAWSDKDGHAAKYYHNDLDYRTWKPDLSITRKGLVMIVSTKIDQPRVGYDDHVVLLAAFNTACATITAQAGVQRKANKSAAGKVIVGKAGVDVAGELKKSVDSCIQSITGKDDTGFEYLGSIAAINLDCMQKAVKYR
jgi:hypothetical protein